MTQASSTHGVCLYGRCMTMVPLGGGVNQYTCYCSDEHRERHLASLKPRDCLGCRALLTGNNVRFGVFCGDGCRRAYAAKSDRAPVRGAAAGSVGT